MTWGQIKKAINSTLGTKDFQPLNEIFSNGIQKLKDAISNGTLICGKSKVLHDDSFELEIQEKMIESNSQLLVSHQGVEEGIYYAEISFVSFWEGRNSSYTTNGFVKIFPKDSNASLGIVFSGTSVSASFGISTSEFSARVSPVYTASSGYINSEIEYVKIKKIF